MLRPEEFPLPAPDRARFPAAYYSRPCGSDAEKGQCHRVNINGSLMVGDRNPDTEARLSRFQHANQHRRPAKYVAHTHMQAASLSEATQQHAAALHAERGKLNAALAARLSRSLALSFLLGL